MTFGDLNPGGNNILAALENGGANVLETAGGAWSFGGATWRCLGFIALATARQMCALTVGDSDRAPALPGDTGTADQENLCAVYGSALTADLLVTPPGGAVSPLLLATARPLALAVPVAQGVPAAPAPEGYATDRTSTDGDLIYTGGSNGLRAEPVSQLSTACNTASVAASPTLNQLTLIHGEERFLVDRSAHEWRVRARPPQLDIEVFDAPGRLDELRLAVAEMPLFDPQRALLLRDPPQLTGSAKRGGVDPPERLVAILGGARADHRPVHGRARKGAGPQRRARCGRARGGSIVFHAAVKGRDLRSWVEREVAVRGLRLGSGSVDHIGRVAGPDLGSIASELDKLVAFAADRPLSIAEVRMAVAGDEAAGLYDTLGELLGPTPARGAESIDRLLSEGRAGQYLLGHPRRPDSRPRAGPGVRPGARFERGPRGGPRQTRLASRSPQPSDQGRVTSDRCRLARGVERRRPKAQNR